MKKLNLLLVLMTLVPVLSFGQYKFEQTFLSNNDDFLYSTDLITANTTYISAGYTDVNVSSSKSDILVINWDNLSLGANWAVRFTGPGVKDDIARKIMTTANGGSLIVGNTNSYKNSNGSYNNEAFVLKLSSNASIQAFKIFGGINNDVAMSCCQNDSNYYVCGRFARSTGTLTDGIVYAFKKSNGNQVFGKEYSNPNDTSVSFSSIIVGNDGNLIIGGTVLQGGHSFFCAKINPLNGRVIWSNVYAGATGGCMNVAKAANNNGYILTGYRYVTRTADLNDIYLLKINENGNFSWSSTYNGNTSNVGNTEDNGTQTIYSSTNSSYAIYGVTNSFKSDDVFLMNTDSLGLFSWARTYHNRYSTEGTLSFHNTGDALLNLGSDGFVIVSGKIRTATSSYDSYMIRANSNGNTDCDSTRTFTRATQTLTRRTLRLDTTLVTSRDTVITRVELGTSVDTICSKSSLAKERSMSVNDESDNYINLTSTLNIFPNPSTGVVHFSLKNMENNDAALFIYDFMGKLVYSDKVDKYRLMDYSADLSKFGKGIFLVKIVDGSTTLSSKFIIQ